MTPATSMAALAIAAWGSSAIATGLATPSPITGWEGGLAALSCTRTTLRLAPGSRLLARGRGRGSG